MTKFKYTITIHMRNGPILTFYSDNVEIANNGVIYFEDKDDPSIKRFTHISNAFVERKMEVI